MFPSDQGRVWEESRRSRAHPPSPRRSLFPRPWLLAGPVTFAFSPRPLSRPGLVVAPCFTLALLRLCTDVPTGLSPRAEGRRVSTQHLESSFKLELVSNPGVCFPPGPRGCVCWSWSCLRKVLCSPYCVAPPGPARSRPARVHCPEAACPRSRPSALPPPGPCLGSRLPCLCTAAWACGVCLSRYCSRLPFLWCIHLVSFL